jgi:hypothetical protein
VKRAFENTSDRAQTFRSPACSSTVAISRLQVIPRGSELPTRKLWPIKVESFRGALTARQWSEVLSISAVTIFKLAERGTLQPFRVGSCARFRPRSVADWLRTRGG